MEINELIPKHFTPVPVAHVVEHPLRDREVAGSNLGRAIPNPLTTFSGFIASSFRVTEENLVFETVQSGPYSSFECFLCSIRNSFLYFICCHCSWYCAVWQP